MYHRALTVLSLKPFSGPSFGGTEVVVTGLGFTFHNGSLRGPLCSFGGIFSVATVINSSALSCFAPRHSAASVPVEVSLNGQDFSSSGILFEFDSFIITRVAPVLGAWTGGTDVLVELDLIPTAGVLFCRFGNLSPVPAARMGVAALQCKSPSHPIGLAKLALVSLDHELSESTWEFEYILEPEVYMVNPQRGMASTRTPVYVTGAHFVNSTSLLCTFGNVRTNATFISNSTVLCATPFLTDIISDHMTVPVRVTVNGLDFSSTAAMFEYHICPFGSYCFGSQIIPCPAGAFCDGSGSNVTLCLPGTYQPKTASSHCTPCPIGYFCPTKGMTEPAICPAGLVCSLSGLSYPDAVCPSGHFCPPGVATVDPSSEKTGKHPLECPENTWCAAGATTNISAAGDFSTPQPCLTGFVCYRGSDTPQGSGPCPTGYYCPPTSLPIQCPASNYCPGVGNVFPSLCTPGFYNDQAGRQSCIECPLGHICPEVGLRSPMLCPAGSVCNAVGLKFPSSRCPPGYYCLMGTETEDWNSETSFKPRPCPEATYCLGGIRSSYTNEADYNAPQPCPHGQFCKEASTSPFGTGRCPRGFFCPKGTSDPYPAPAGYFCAGEGNAMAAPCLPGTWAKYNPESGTDTCLPCPGGYSCEREGTYEPRPCLPGFYRQFNKTVSCEACPEGKWNPFYANPSEVCACCM